MTIQAYLSNSLLTSKLKIQTNPKIEKAHNKSAVDEATRAEVWWCYWFERHRGEDAGERERRRDRFSTVKIHRSLPPSTHRKPEHRHRVTVYVPQTPKTTTLRRKPSTNDDQIQRSVCRNHKVLTRQHTQTLRCTHSHGRCYDDDRRRRTAVGASVGVLDTTTETYGRRSIEITWKTDASSWKTKGCQNSQIDSDVAADAIATVAACGIFNDTQNRM